MLWRVELQGVWYQGKDQGTSNRGRMVLSTAKDRGYPLEDESVKPAQ